MQTLTYFGLTIASNTSVPGTAHLMQGSPDNVKIVGGVQHFPRRQDPQQIQCTTFMHPQLYNYQTHQPKCQALCTGQLLALNQFLQDVHRHCSDTPFLSGPRSSKMRYSVPVEISHVTNHPRSSDAAAGLEQYARRYNTAHSQVQCYMLEKDATTIGVEVPVWIDSQEAASLPFELAANECLSGHIDLVSIEDGCVCIWDYKPRAIAEKFATVQVALYAYMLSVRSGIPLDLFRCGYFDCNDCFLFVPAPKALAAMQEVQ